MSTLCHLTGMPIDKNDPVLVLPVRYQTPSSSNFCYHAEQEAMLFAMPFRAVMGEFSSFKKPQPEASLCLDFVNNRICRDIPRVMRGARVALRADGTMQEHGCHLDESIMEKFKDNPAPQFSNMFDLMEALRFGSLHDDGYKRNHYSYLLVRLDFFETLIAEQYAAELALVEAHMDDLLSRTHSLNELGEDALRAAAMSVNTHIFYEGPASNLIDSSNHYPKFQMETALSSFWMGWEDAGDAASLKTAFVYAFLINAIYRDLGKTFLPIASRRNGEKQHAFTQLLLNVQIQRRNQIREKYSDEQGYDEDARQDFQWR